MMFGRPLQSRRNSSNEEGDEENESIEKRHFGYSILQRLLISENKNGRRRGGAFYEERVHEYNFKRVTV